jgi:hypothetical protein
VMGDDHWPTPAMMTGAVIPVDGGHLMSTL